jgi:hypothetical protein
MAVETTIRLRPIVRFREFPFGTAGDPSMREFMADKPWSDQDKLLQYLRSGHVLGLTMGADLIDWFDRPHKANPVIDGRIEGGTTPLTDGVWFWYAGLIHFIERYNVRVPDEFVQHAARQDWRAGKNLTQAGRYEYSYFGDRIPSPSG